MCGLRSELVKQRDFSCLLRQSSPVTLNIHVCIQCISGLFTCCFFTKHKLKQFCLLLILFQKLYVSIAATRILEHALLKHLQQWQIHMQAPLKEEDWY